MSRGSPDAWGRMQESDGALKLQASREGAYGVRIGHFLYR